MEKTMVLIHGYGFDRRIWCPVELAFEGCRVVYLSLPGFGGVVPKEPYTIQSLAQQYWKEIDTLGLSDVHLGGHSMGGYVCIEMVAQQPKRIASLALVHSHVFSDPEEKKQQRNITMEGIRTQGRSFLVHKMIPSLFGDQDEYRKTIDRLVIRGMSYEDAAWLYGAQAMRDRTDHAITLKNLTSPVLMIMGEKDVAVPTDLVYKQAGLSEYTRLHIYAGVGHMAMYEKPARMISDLAGFYEAFL